MDIAIVIPARYRSSRFPGKPLIEIAGKSMIRRTWERCIQAVPEDSVFVATDDERIASHCRGAGIRTVMTRPDCLTGTDRVHDASRHIDAEVFLNVQGDEPLIDPKDILEVIEASRANPGMVINAMCPIVDKADSLRSTIPKVVVRPDKRLLYMSRAPIPSSKSQRFANAMKQVCIYAFPKQALHDFAAVRCKTPLEESEDIEILRVLELGSEVLMVEVSQASIAVDTPEDVARVEAALHARA